jgi:hypothetical protein
MGNEEAREHAELIMLYEQATQAIRTFQERQTSIANLTIVVALIAIGNITKGAEVPWLRNALPLFAVAAAVMSIGWLSRLQSAMCRARGKVTRARVRFTKAFEEASGPEHQAGWLEGADTLPVLFIVILAGVVVTVAVLGSAI